MRVHILQHVPAEGPGTIADWLAARGADVSVTRFFEEATLPSPAGLDLVIALGGPMSVNDEAELPWLVAEKAFLREVMAQGSAVLGICLGAQLIASALGARVYPNAVREIGWFALQAVHNTSEVFRLPDCMTVLHWHGETFELPPGAMQLARSAACEQQAFQIGRRVIGLQCHLETDEALVRAFAEQDADQLVPAEWVQDAGRILAAPPSQYAEMRAVMDALLDWLTAPV